MCPRTHPWDTPSPRWRPPTQTRAASSGSYDLTGLCLPDPIQWTFFRYRLDYAGSEGLTEAGSLAEPAAWRALLSLGAVTGRLATAARLDRETVQQLRLSVLVEDIAAEGPAQLARARCWS
jgi:hypothetical protein